MTIEKNSSVALVELFVAGSARVTSNIIVTEGADIITSGQSVETFVPGADLTALPADAQATITAWWTEDRVAAWQAAQEEAPQV